VRLTYSRVSHTTGQHGPLRHSRSSRGAQIVEVECEIKERCTGGAAAGLVALLPPRLVRDTAVVGSDELQCHLLGGPVNADGAEVVLVHERADAVRAWLISPSIAAVRVRQRGGRHLVHLVRRAEDAGGHLVVGSDVAVAREQDDAVRVRVGDELEQAAALQRG